MKELEPCPFCGNNTAPCLIDSKEFDNEYGIDWMDYKEYEVQYQVVCELKRSSKPLKTGCGAASGWANSKEEAIEKWNRRAT